MVVSKSYFLSPICQLPSGSVMNKWCMKLNDSETNIREYFRKLRDEQRLFDVTLATDDGEHMQAHKTLLSSGSYLFSDIFFKSNQTNMLIYLKGIASVQLKHLLDFIYNGEASLGKEELKDFLETGEELQVKGLTGDGEIVEHGPVGLKAENEERHENKETLSEENVICDTLETSTEENFLDGPLNDTTGEKNQIKTHMDLDQRINEMMEKSDGLWECKVCGRTAESSGHIREHAETHIEGMSHPCHICKKTFSNRAGLRKHIYHVHSELFSCDLCGKTEMNRRTYSNHKQSKLHKELSGQSSKNILEIS